MTRDEFSYAGAIQLRSAKAVAAAGGYQKNLQAVVERVVREHGAQLNSTEYLRAQGGWSTIILTAIGPAPLELRNELGIATNPAYYVFRMLVDRSQDIRWMIARLLQQQETV